MDLYIITIVPVSPRKAVCHEKKWNVGLKKKMNLIKTEEQS